MLPILGVLLSQDLPKMDKVELNASTDSVMFNISNDHFISTAQSVKVVVAGECRRVNPH
jgi:hypothetical protein